MSRWLVLTVIVFFLYFLLVISLIGVRVNQPTDGSETGGLELAATSTSYVIQAGDTIELPLTIRAKGDASDTVQLSTQRVPTGWQATFYDNDVLITEATVQPESPGQVILKLKAPTNASVGETHRITAIAVVEDSGVEVDQTYKVTVTSGKQTADSGIDSTNANVNWHSITSVDFGSTNLNNWQHTVIGTGNKASVTQGIATVQGNGLFYVKDESSKSEEPQAWVRSAPDRSQLRIRTRLRFVHGYDRSDGKVRAGITGRYQGDGRGYTAWITYRSATGRAYVNFGRMDGATAGIDPLVDPVLLSDYDPHTWHTIEITFNESVILVSVDGEQVIKVRDATYMAGEAGLYYAGGGYNGWAQYDDFALLTDSREKHGVNKEKGKRSSATGSNTTNQDSPLIFNENNELPQQAPDVDCEVGETRLRGLRDELSKLYNPKLLVSYTDLPVGYIIACQGNPKQASQTISLFKLHLKRNMKIEGIIYQGAIDPAAAAKWPYEPVDAKLRLQGPSGKQISRGDNREGKYQVIKDYKVTTTGMHKIGVDFTGIQASKLPENWTFKLWVYPDEKNKSDGQTSSPSPDEQDDSGPNIDALQKNVEDRHSDRFEYNGKRYRLVAFYSHNMAEFRGKNPKYALGYTLVNRSTDRIVQDPGRARKLLFYYMASHTVGVETIYDELLTVSMGEGRTSVSNWESLYRTRSQRYMDNSKALANAGKKVTGVLVFKHGLEGLMGDVTAPATMTKVLYNYHRASNPGADVAPLTESLNKVQSIDELKDMGKLFSDVGQFFGEVSRAAKTLNKGEDLTNATVKHVDSINALSVAVDVATLGDEDMMARNHGEASFKSSLMAASATAVAKSYGKIDEETADASDVKALLLNRYGIHILQKQIFNGHQDVIEANKYNLAFWIGIKSLELIEGRQLQNFEKLASKSEEAAQEVLDLFHAIQQDVDRAMKKYRRKAE